MKNKQKYSGLEIAIIGLSCHVPEAENWRMFWNNLAEGKESIHVLTDDELIKNGVDKKTRDNENFINVSSSIKDKDRFDHSFFNYTKHEANIMNPAHRVFHQSVWEALEDAGYAPGHVDGKISLYAGAGDDSNWRAYATMNNDYEKVDSLTLNFITNKDHLASLIAYKLNLKGPAYTINTACSTSLAAVHLACKGLLLGEAKLAVAGGISLSTKKEVGYTYKEGHIYSSDGHCRTFDKDASGTIGSEGVGVVVLKRLKDAIQDNDHIYAVIKGSAANNDGSVKVGYTAPGVEGQMQCIRTAQKIANVEPSSIGYIEAHGTGTNLGDPIELEALNAAFNHDNSHRCALGSVKTNFGHTDSAAGVIGLIKTALCLKFKQIPASLNYKEANPEIDFKNGPFYVNTTLKKWESSEGKPLRAGVSSFGIGGTNVHAILEEAPEEMTSDASQDYKLLPFSAKTEKALVRYIDQFKMFLKEEPTLNFDDIAHTLQHGRSHFEHRTSFMCKDIANLLNVLDSEKIKDQSLNKKSKRKPIVFLFPGTGSQYIDMGKELYRTEPRFKKKIDEGLALINEITKEDYKKILFPKSKKSEKINEPRYAEPLLFLFEYALASLIKSFGISPDYMIGQGLGEYTAASIAGVLSFEDALALLIKKTDLLSNISPGTMLSALMFEDDAQAFLSDKITLAAVNGTQQIVFSGEESEIDQLKEKLDDLDIINSKHHKKHYHYNQTDIAFKQAFKTELQKIEWGEAQVPYLSGVTAKFIKQNNTTFPDHWVEHVEGTLRFCDGLKKILDKEESLVFVELGPGHTLSDLLKRELRLMNNDSVSINLVRHAKESHGDIESLFNGIGKLWENGIDVNWNDLSAKENRKRVSLPTYSFEPNTYPVAVDSFVRDYLKPVIENFESNKKETLSELKRESKPSKSNGKKQFSETEFFLIKTIEDFFGIENVNPEDDFFELGGDSLKGMSILKKVKDKFNVDLPLLDFLECRTLKEVAMTVDEFKAEKNSSLKTITI